MTLTIELTLEEERRCAAAKEAGVDLEKMVRGLIAGLPEPAERGHDRTLELFAQWEAEEAAMPPEERAEEDEQWEEITENLRQGGIELNVPDICAHD